MAKIFVARSYSIFLAGLLFASFMPTHAEERDAVAVSQNQDVLYIRLDKGHSNIAQVISELSALDADVNSPLHLLKQHIEDGFVIGIRDEVVQILEYANWFVHQQQDSVITRSVAMELDQVINQVLEGSLDMTEEAIMRDHSLRLLKVNERMTVLGKTIFKSDVIIKKKLRVHGKARFYEDVCFKDDVKIDEDLTVKGTLSAADAIVGDLTVLSCMDSLCVNNLSVTDLIVDNLSVVDLLVDNISVTDLVAQNASITDLVVDNLTVVNCMDNLCVNDLSVTDLTISGTLSLNDAIIQDATITNLSSTDAVIQDLTVVNCMDNLCVNSLSVTDLAISGTLSLNDAIIQDATITNLSSTDAVIQDLTVVNCMSDLCVNALSVVDGSVSGTLSVNDEVVTGNVQFSSLTPAGVVHNSATGVLSSSLIVNADVSPSAAIVDTKLATLSTAGKVANSATTATSANTANAIVSRDGSGNFSAGTITANLNGNATTATTATTATNFSGSLSGDVTGTQGATVVSFVGGQSAANVAAATVLANGATSANTASAIVRRDGSGNFSTNMITISGVVTNPTDAATKNYVDTTIGATGTNLNTPNTLVKRDSTGSFAAQTISLVDEVVSGNISLSDSTSATVGNVNKAGVRFIHNFGTDNTFVGKNAGNFTMSGTGDNTGVGVNALVSNVTGTDCTAVGSGALQSNTTGQLNTAVGAAALASNASSFSNVAIGYQSLNAHTTSANNTAVGTFSMATDVAGFANTAVGFEALYQANGAGSNVAVGAYSGALITTGSSNTLIGTQTTPGNSLTTGNANVFIGNNVGYATTTGSNNVYIAGSSLSPANESDTTRIGNTQTRAFMAGVRGVVTGVADAIPVLIDSTGQLGTTSSSRRFKHNIAAMEDKSARIYELNPVTFAYNEDATEKEQFGLIAEEVDAVFPELVVHEADGAPYTVHYEVLPVLLLNEMQKLASKVDVMDEALASVKEQVAELVARG